MTNEPNLIRTRLILIVYGLLFLLLGGTAVLIVSHALRIYPIDIAATRAAIPLFVFLVALLAVLGILIAKIVNALQADNEKLLQKEKELRKSEDLYRELFNRSPLPKWVCDRHTLKFYEVNDSALAHYGYSREEFLSLTVFDVRVPQDHGSLQSAIDAQNFLDERKIVRKHVKKNGDIISVERYIDEIDYHGKEALLVTINDITDKLAAERAISASEALYRSLFNNSPVFILLADLPTLRILDVNETAVAHYGYAREEFLSMTAFDLIAPSNREEVRSQVQRSVEKAHRIDQHLKKNGETVTVEVRVVKIDFRGQRAALVIGADVTEKLRAEEKVRSSEELYRSLFNKNPLPSFVVDKDTLQFLEANDTAVELYGYSKKEFLSLSVFDLRPLDDHDYLKAIVSKAISHDSVNYHVTHLKKNREKIVVDVSLTTIRYEGKEAWLAIVKDITKTLQLEEQLYTEQLNRQMEITRATIRGQEEERNELGKELHDNVNQILATARLYLESALTPGHDPAEWVEKGKTLVGVSIQEIRTLSKSLVAPSLGERTLREALGELVESLHIKKDIRLKIRRLNEHNLCNDLKVSVYRIAQEQLNNILKHANASSVTISLQQSDQQLELRISDDGQGFDPSKKRKGIGITNMINRAALFGGEVIVNSAPGKGCIVIARFKLEPASVDESPRDNKHSFNGGTA